MIFWSSVPQLSPQLTSFSIIGMEKSTFSLSLFLFHFPNSAHLGRTNQSLFTVDRRSIIHLAGWESQLSTSKDGNSAVRLWKWKFNCPLLTIVSCLSLVTRSTYHRSVLGDEKFIFLPWNRSQSPSGDNFWRCMETETESCKVTTFDSHTVWKPVPECYGILMLPF